MSSPVMTDFFSPADGSSFAALRQIKHSTKCADLQEKTKIIVRRFPTKNDKNKRKQNN